MTGPLTAVKPEDCPAPPGDVEITVWSATETQGDVLKRAMISEYQQANPQVHITYTGLLDTSDAFTKFLTAAGAGGGPTIFGTYFANVPPLHDQKLIAPAVPTAMCGTSHQDIINRYVPGALDLYTFDGNVEALPTQQNTFSLLVNNKLFSAAGLSLSTDIPKTWDEVAALQAKLKKVDANNRVIQKGFEFRYVNSGWYIDNFAELLYQLNGRIFDDAGAPIWNSEKGVEVLRQWKENVVDPKVTTNVSNNPYNDFANEQDVMTYGGPNAVSFVEELNPAMKGNITVAPMPKAGPGPNVYYGFPDVVNAHASDAQKAAAWNFLNYLYSDPNRWFKDTGLLQPLTGWYDLPAAKAFTGLDVYISDLTGALPEENPDNYGAFADALTSAIDRVMLQNKDPKASLDQSVQEYNTAIGH